MSDENRVAEAAGEISQTSSAEPNGGRRPLRVGLLGLGRAGILSHLPELKALPEQFQITAVCDLMKERRDLVAGDLPGAKMYRRVEDMLDDPDIDLVDIASRSSDHLEHVLAALQRGKWTVVESPLAMSHDDALVIRAADVKARGRLIVRQLGAFQPDFLAALKASEDPRLGEVYDIRVRKELFIRRDDWQSVKRCGGGAAFYACPDLVYQALALLKIPPYQIWSELKRVASLGDAEDFAHIVLKTRGPVTADIIYSGAEIEPTGPAFEIRGERGVFRIMPNQREGVLHVIDPAHKFPRRRSSVRTPALDDMRETFKVVDFPIACDVPPELSGPVAFWKAVYGTVRTATPFPISLDESIEPIRLLTIAKKASPFAK